jgi:hypothetical protein
MGRKKSVQSEPTYSSEEDHNIKKRFPPAAAGVIERKKTKSTERIFTSKVTSIEDDTEFANFLKTLAHKQKSLSLADRSELVSQLQVRVPRMKPSCAAGVLWSLGTLKVPLRSQVSI